MLLLISLVVFLKHACPCPIVERAERTKQKLRNRWTEMVERNDGLKREQLPLYPLQIVQPL